MSRAAEPPDIPAMPTLTEIEAGVLKLRREGQDRRARRSIW